MIELKNDRPKEGEPTNPEFIAMTRAEFFGPPYRTHGMFNALKDSLERLETATKDLHRSGARWERQDTWIREAVRLMEKAADEAEYRDRDREYKDEIRELREHIAKIKGAE